MKKNKIIEEIEAFNALLETFINEANPLLKNKNNSKTKASSLNLQAQQIESLKNLIKSINLLNERLNDKQVYKWCLNELTNEIAEEKKERKLALILEKIDDKIEKSLYYSFNLTSTKLIAEIEISAKHFELINSILNFRKNIFGSYTLKNLIQTLEKEEEKTKQWIDNEINNNQIVKFINLSLNNSGNLKYKELIKEKIGEYVVSGFFLELIEMKIKQIEEQIDKIKKADVDNKNQSLQKKIIKDNLNDFLFFFINKTTINKTQEIIENSKIFSKELKEEFEIFILNKAIYEDEIFLSENSRKTIKESKYFDFYKKVSFEAKFNLANSTLNLVYPDICKILELIKSGSSIEIIKELNEKKPFYLNLNSEDFDDDNGGLTINYQEKDMLNYLFEIYKIDTDYSFSIYKKINAINEITGFYSYEKTGFEIFTKYKNDLKNEHKDMLEIFEKKLEKEKLLSISKKTNENTEKENKKNFRF